MWTCYLLAYGLSIFAAHIVIGPAIRVMHYTSDAKTDHDSLNRSYPIYSWQGFWVGGTERAIVTTLVIYSPQNLSIFIGGWVAAKLAAGWSRYSGPEYASANFISLVGSVLSVSAAIAAGGAWKRRS